MALELPNKRYLGFHAYNLNLAEISPEAWSGLQAGALKELTEWSDHQDPETSDAKENHFINSLSINVAQVCNLKCSYCAAGGDGTYGSQIPNLELKRIEKQLSWIANQLPENESLSIHFLGGEPMLYPKTIQFIADYVKTSFPKISFQFSITTNGTLINRKSAALLASLNCAVTVSLDGPKSIHDSYRPSKNKSSSTEMTLAGLKELKKVRNELSALNINSVFGEHNTDVVSTYKFLKELDIEIDFYNFNYANNANNQKFTDEYLANMQELAKTVYEDAGLVELAKFTQFRSALTRIEAQTRNHSYCGAGKSLLQIDTEHKLYPCNWFMGDEKEAVGQDTQLDANKWSSYSKSLVELNDCGTCWNRHICAGGCMAVHKDASGSKHIKDPLFCLRSRSLSAMAIYYYGLELIKGENNEAH